MANASAESGQPGMCLFLQGKECTSRSTAARVLRQLRAEGVAPLTLHAIDRRARTIPSMAQSTDTPGVFVCRRALGEPGTCDFYEERKVPVVSDDALADGPVSIHIPVIRSQ